MGYMTRLVRKAFAVLLGVALVVATVATVPVVAAPQTPPAVGHAAHHDAAPSADDHHAPCDMPCDCKGQPAAHCCAQAAAAVAPGAGLPFAVRVAAARSSIPYTIDEESVSLHPPTPPPKPARV